MSEQRPPLYTPAATGHHRSPPPLPSGLGASPGPSPSDHIRTLVELLKPGTPDLARRWLAALLLVPSDEREAVVSEVERRVVSEYVDRAAAREVVTGGAYERDREIVVRYPAVQREGYVEEVVKRYGVAEDAAVDGVGEVEEVKRRRAGG